MDKFLELMNESDSSLADEVRPAAGARRVEHFREKLTFLMDTINNKKGLPSWKRYAILKEAETTSDFPALFGTVLERSLVAKYNIAKPDWKTYIKVGSQNDFRAANLLGLYGLQSNMPQVRERGEYKADKLFDGKVSNTLLKYGRQFPLSWEAMINDDLGAFRDIADRLANAALRTEYVQATKLFVQSSGPNTALFGTALTHPLDATTINNKGVLAFTADNLAKTIALMRLQTDSDGEPIVFDGFELVYGPQLEIRVLQALNPASLITTGMPTGAVATQTSANVVTQLNIHPHMNPYLPVIDTSGNNQFTWYVFGTLSSGTAAQMNFLRGHESPEIVQKVSDKVAVGGGLVTPMEGDFDTDTMRWRVRHILGGTQVDPRLAYAQVANS